MKRKNFYKSLFNLTGKNAIVTGGAGILGEHICMALCEFGANVAIVDIDQERAIDLADKIKEEHSNRVMGVYCDVSKPDSVKEMLLKVVEEFRYIHILNNTAASKSSSLNEFFKDFEEYSLTEWREIMAVNIDAMFLVTQLVGNHMLKYNIKGSIIQTSSIYGMLASDKRIYDGSHYLGMQISNPAVYSTSKAAVIGLTRYLAAYWGDKGIRVNALVPGGIESGQNQIFKRNYSARVPLSRMANAYEIVGALIYLASDASSYVTGQSLIVDGGLSAW